MIKFPIATIENLLVQKKACFFLFPILSIQNRVVVGWWQIIVFKIWQWSIQIKINNVNTVITTVEKCHSADVPRIPIQMYSLKCHSKLSLSHDVKAWYLLKLTFLHVLNNKFGSEWRLWSEVNELVDNIIAVNFVSTNQDPFHQLQF